MQLAKEVQRKVAKFLYKETGVPFTNMEEWAQTQTYLAQSINELMKQEGATPDEEAEAVLAILMGYTIAVRNPKNIISTLERAEKVFPNITSPLLKCQLAIFCYGECYDEELSIMAHTLIEELKHSEKDTGHLGCLEELLQSFAL